MQKGKPNCMWRSVGIRARCCRKILPVCFRKKLKEIIVRRMLSLGPGVSTRPGKCPLRPHNPVPYSILVYLPTNSHIHRTHSPHTFTAHIHHTHSPHTFTTHIHHEHTHGCARKHTRGCIKK